MDRRRFFAKRTTASGGDNAPYIHLEEVLDSQIDTGMKLLSDEYPTWTIFSHQDLAPADSSIFTLWSLWQNNSSSYNECGMDCIKASAQSNTWWRGYCLRVKDTYQKSYQKSYNGNYKWVTSVWSYQLQYPSPLTFALQKRADGYYFSTNGTDWEFLLSYFTLQHMTFKYGVGTVDEGGATEMALWLTDDVELTDYFAKYQ